jgi:C4-dicarboxylate transporter, DctQ subunit
MDREAQTSHSLAEEVAGHPAGAIPEAGVLGRMIDKVGVVFALAFLVSMAILIIEIFMRYVVGQPTLWAHESSIFLCAISFIFGGLYCAAHDKHIRVVLIYDALGPRGRRMMDVAISIVCALSACFFAYASWLMVERALWSPNGNVRLETTGSAWNPPTPALLKAFMLVVLAVLAVQFLILAFNYARRKG